MSKVCLATVTTKEFIPATLVMLHSFRKHNPWFDGDIVIIHNHLNAEYQRYLKLGFPNIVFFQVSDVIKKALRPLLSLRPDLLFHEASFYTMEIFRLRGYEKVLFYDGDILFQDSIRELFEMDDNLICSGEGLYYTDGCRDAVSLIDLHGEDCRQEGLLRNTFSGGFLLVDRFFLTDEHYVGLLKMLDANKWKAIKVRMTDQAVFNLYFAGQQRIVSSQYNYLLRHRSLIYMKDGINFKDAKALHYNGPIKPWDAEQVLVASQRDPALIQATRLWQDAYADILQNLHLKNKFQTIRGL